MKRAWANFPAVWRRLPARALCGLIVAMTLGGCAMPRWSRMPGMGEAAEYHPTNVHRKSDVLPLEIKRVAVLPMSGMTDDPSLDAGEEKRRKANQKGRQRKKRRKTWKIEKTQK